MEDLFERNPYISNIIEITVLEMGEFFENREFYETAFTLRLNRDGEVFLMVDNFDIMFYLFRVEGDTVYFEDTNAFTHNTLSINILELLERIHPEDVEGKIDNRLELMEYCTLKNHKPWARLSQSILDLPRVLRDEFNNRSINLLYQ